ncbi:MAG: helix-turn-helix domain-containing protein, partial [Candidatus Nanopelagicales bacterium]|nr:helix-turn-helix domain-containing protein [Candidatus Nanopelagicales bacterium]
MSTAELPAPVVPGLPRSLFTAEEAAAALSVSETLVRQLTLTGELPCRRIGRLVRYAQADVDAFVARCDQQGYAPRSRT